jgi:hypothetical protein
MARWLVPAVNTSFRPTMWGCFKDLSMDTKMQSWSSAFCNNY